MATMPTAPTPPTGKPTSTDVARWTPLVRVRGRSMQPTLAPGRLLPTRPAGGRVAAGDIVVVTAAPGTFLVKRVAAMAGDVVELEAGRLYVNGRPWPVQDGQARVAGALVQGWRVPPGHCFIVGDNLRESDDSRVWPAPFVALSRISGVALRRRPWTGRGRPPSEPATDAPARCRFPAAP